MATLVSHKIGGRGSRERVDMNARLNHALIAHLSTAGSAYLQLDFSDGERSFSLTMNREEFRTLLKNSLSVDTERLAIILNGGPNDFSR